MKYFYIITFDTQIFEIIYTAEKLEMAFREWQKGGLLLLKELGSGIHASSISKILNQDLYESYIFNVKPKLYIKNGTWYDGKEFQIVRHEKWKQDEIDNRGKLPSGEERKLSKEETSVLLEKYKPDFLKY